MIKCKECKKEFNPIDEFPGKLCPACYYKKMDKIPIEKLQKPNFIKAINK